ncbi:serine/threonine-protein kinase [Streptomyces sp. YIM 98790]|uniref:serine/threonine-protein kinase n=1 Tax=Streptomyces sp. YIM 98790 TaxID=2689077 RepID=UPI001FB7579D|nr:serine/threonine-protein kinase [Streptomyces sp. YIM 98790]
MQALGAEDPSRIGPFRLQGRLGEGDMGQVYLARSEHGDRVAVKLVRPGLARLPTFRRRFRREVDAARRIGGRWTVPVRDADPDAATPWVATDYLPAPSLHEVVTGEHGPLPERSLPALANGLTHALRDIHEAGLVHRDLKPSGILITRNGPRVIDSGIARAVEAATTTLTRTGAVVGSPGFMSPEQCRGEVLTPASDVFCLGSVLAFAATGRSPFGGTGTDAPSLLRRIVQGDHDLGGVPGTIRGLVEECLAPEPADRPTLSRLLERTREGSLWEPAADPDADPWLPAALTAEPGRQTAELPPVGRTPAAPDPPPAAPARPSVAPPRRRIGLPAAGAVAAVAAVALVAAVLLTRPPGGTEPVVTPVPPGPPGVSGLPSDDGPAARDDPGPTTGAVGTTTGDSGGSDAGAGPGSGPTSAAPGTESLPPDDARNGADGTAPGTSSAGAPSDAGADTATGPSLSPSDTATDDTGDTGQSVGHTSGGADAGTDGSTGDAGSVEGADSGGSLVGGLVGGLLGGSGD